MSDHHSHSKYNNHGCSHEHEREHHHGHSHGHGHHHHAPTSFGFAFALTLLVNFLYLGVEIGWGFFSNSMSLLADAGHNTVDLLSLVAAWVAHLLAKRKAQGRFTYGLKKATVLTALSNGILLSFVTSGLLYASILKLQHPTHVEGRDAAIVIAGGIIINLVSALLLLRGSKEDLNIKGAFLHLLGDAMFGAGILIANIAIYFTGWNILDPIIGIMVSIFILYTAIRMSLESLNMAMDAVPADIDLNDVLKQLRNIPNVKNVHHLHIWSMSTSETALTVHLVIDDDTKMQVTLKAAQEHLRNNFRIAHSTIQFEPKNHDCSDEQQSCC